MSHALVDVSAAALAADLSSAHSAILDQVYDEYRDRLELGEPVDVESLCGRWPEYASSIRRMIAADRLLESKLHLLLPPAPPPRWPEPGETLLGFHLLEELNRGSFSRVFLAEDCDLGRRRVVLKVSGLGSAEADTLGKLEHANIVPVHSVEHDPDRQVTVVCMPYQGRATLEEVRRHAFACGGPPVSSRVILEAACAAEDHKRPAAAQAFPARAEYAAGVVYLAAKIADALDKAHRLGICHRDLKPRNVLVRPDGEPMLLDFNLSFDTEHGIERRGGTIAYMAPEQLALLVGEPPSLPTVDGRADLFALGAMLYELLTGRHPFFADRTESPPSRLAALAAEKHRLGFPDPRTINPSIDYPLAQIIRRCLAIDPKDRPQTAAELARDLRRWMTPTNQWLRWTRRRKWWLAAAAAVLFSAAAVADFSTPKNSPPAVSLRTEYHAGVAALQRGDPAAALRHLDNAVAAEPDFADAHFARGQTYLKLGNVAAAHSAFRRAFEIGSDPRALACCAFCLQAQYQHSQAAWLYEQSIELGLDTAEVRNNLALALSKKSPFTAEKAKQAREHLFQAIQLNPRLAAAYDNLAVLELEQALSDENYVPLEGVAFVEKALELGPESAALRVRAAHLHALCAVSDPVHQRAAIHHLLRAAALGEDIRFAMQTPQFAQLADDPQLRAAVKNPAPAKPMKLVPRFVHPCP